ncbi:hypothetical protein [Amycolatopsis sp.]|uniref:hypothetical protein n=1 Tax=Amycolatopsis sp. TaxID=37632 RepID=UPI002C155F89|nr:hypothetical protein [Amycolatopsis sp.]HVV13631.1 hypothetical protein [Amycolatopsis sp.]
MEAVPPYYWEVATKLGDSWIWQGSWHDGFSREDLEAVLRRWHDRRGGRGGLWRLQVIRREDKEIVAEAQVVLDEHWPPPRRRAFR